MIILVNCYVEKRDEKIGNYKKLFGKFGKIKVIHDENFSPDRNARAYVISGSEKNVSQNDYNLTLLKFLKETESPVIGICYGHHLIAKAFGARVERGELIKKHETIKILKNDEIFSGLSQYFIADESHKDHVVETEEFKKEFEIIASSESCSIEVIKHKRKFIFGFQFHIERSGKNGEIIARNLFRLIGEKNVK